MSRPPAEPPRPASASVASPTPVLDTIDLAVLRLLRRRPRAPLADVATALGIHERTVARRLDRLTATGRIRFTAVLIHDFLGGSLIAELAVRCAPGRLHDTALALARRSDTHSVEVATGTPEVFVEMAVPDQRHLLNVVDGSIARMDGVTGVHSQVVLRLLLTANDWAPFDDEPTELRRAVSEGRPLPEPIAVDELDEQLVALLQADARMSMTRLARELRVGESTARRRMARLMGSHILHLRLEAEPELLGFPVEARFRLAAAPEERSAVLRALGREPAVRHLVLTTGTHSLLGYSSHRTLEELDAFTTRAFRDAGSAVETALLMRSYKRVGRMAA
ncbi:Lrp/AsnC family transcriptional regulator [Kitasatospora sp. NPDC057015]|uniref:Lrp/AsnC family transcriptional regulator n=1 Tax=Kitasatospora sp. NPDC057015 TaxID=3346001 RepID=UPI0036360C05